MLGADAPFAARLGAGGDIVDKLALIGNGFAQRFRWRRHLVLRVDQPVMDLYTPPLPELFAVRRPLGLVPQYCLPTGNGRKRRRFGTQDARPQSNWGKDGIFGEGVKLRRRPAAFGTYEYGLGRGGILFVSGER